MTLRRMSPGWTTFSGAGKVAVSHEATDVKEGKGALKFEYEIKKDQMSILALPVGDGALGKMKSMKFWMKSDYATTIAIGIQEKDEGRYGAMFALPAGKWQLVELANSDFVLNEEPTDPKDPDGKLEMDKAEAVFVMDLSNLFAQVGDSPLAKLFNIKTGPHSLLMDDFAVNEASLPAGFGKDAAGYRIDSDARPQVSWIAVGGGSVLATSGKPLDGEGNPGEVRA